MPNVIDKSVSWIIFMFISINKLRWTIHNSAEGRLWHMDFCAITSIGCLPQVLPQGGLYCQKRVCLLCEYRFKSMSSQTAATKFLSCRTSRADSPHSFGPLTRFCTMHILSLLSSATIPYMSTKSWSFICCVKWSRAMKTPVLPTPAL